MADARNSWAELFQAVGEGWVSVLKAEITALSGKWKRWGGRVAVVVGLFATSAAVLFSALLLLPYFLTALVKHLSGWSWMTSSGLVFSIVVLAGALLGAVGYWRLRGLDDPIAMTREQVDNHMNWSKSLLADPADGAGGRAVLNEAEPTQGEDDGGSEE